MTVWLVRMALPDDASLLLRKITKNATIQVEKDKKLILMIKFYWFERTNETYIFLKSFNQQPLFNRTTITKICFCKKSLFAESSVYIKLIKGLYCIHSMLILSAIFHMVIATDLRSNQITWPSSLNNNRGHNISFSLNFYQILIDFRWKSMKLKRKTTENPLV